MSGLGLFVRKIVRSNIENEYQNKKHQYFYAGVPTLRLYAYLTCGICRTLYNICFHHLLPFPRITWF